MLGARSAINTRCCDNSAALFLQLQMPAITQIVRDNLLGYNKLVFLKPKTKQKKLLTHATKLNGTSLGFMRHLSVLGQHLENKNNIGRNIHRAHCSCPIIKMVYIGCSKNSEQGGLSNFEVKREGIVSMLCVWR
jgi:hypothetical protein